MLCILLLLLSNFCIQVNLRNYKYEIASIPFMIKVCSPLPGNCGLAERMSQIFKFVALKSCFILQRKHYVQKRRINEWEFGEKRDSSRALNMTALLIGHCRILFGTDGVCRQGEETFYLKSCLRRLGSF